jgi:hypothetical protein
MTVALFSLLALGALIFLVGLMLPRQREFVREAVLKSPVDQVFQLVTQVENQASWRTDIQEIRVINEQSWTEVPKKGAPITFRVKKKVDNQLFEIEIVEPRSFQGYWTGNFESVASGTKVLFKEVITIENPFFRVMGAVFVDLNKTMDEYLHCLKKATE